MIQADGTAQAVIIACLSTGTLLAIATAIWAYVESLREQGHRERESWNQDQRLDSHGQRLNDKDQRDQHLQDQISSLFSRQTESPEPLAASGTIRSAEPTIRANATLEPMSLRRRIYWGLIAKSGWLPPWHR